MLELPGMEAQSDVRYANMAMSSHTLQRSLITVISIFCSYIKSLILMLLLQTCIYFNIKPETKEVIDLDNLSSI